MEVKRNLVIEFGESWAPIGAVDFDEDSLVLEQGDQEIYIPKSEAGAFVGAIAEWIATGGRTT